MSLKEIKEAREKGRVFFGVRQAMKNKDKLKKVFIAKDARDTTKKMFSDKKIKFEITEEKSKIKKFLNLNFTTEVISVI